MKIEKIKVELSERDSNRTKIMDVSDENQLFFPVFEKAKKVVALQVLETKLFYSKNHDSDIYRYANNMLAFCGDRGEGKTSAMISFAKALGDGTEYGGFFAEQNPDAGNPPAFFVLPPIDPTTLEAGDSILKTIISRMFLRFAQEEKKHHNEAENPWENHQEMSRQKLLSLFETCFENLSVLHDKNKPDFYSSNLEKLSELGDSANFKTLFLDLVIRFLSYLNKGCDKNCFLVIQVDDADLNFSRAYHIMEELRKYAVIPHVILLISTNIGHLSLAVEQHFMLQYETQLRCNPEFDKSSCHRLAENYIEKILPSARQIRLPILQEILQNNLISLELACFVGVNNETLFCSGEYQSVLGSVIRRKTGVLLEPMLGSMHYFFPRTLRELGHFVDLFRHMPDIFPEKLEEGSYGMTEQYRFFWFTEITEENYHKKRDILSKFRGNLHLLMEYFTSEWASVSLTRTQSDLLKNLHKSSKFNKLEFLITEIVKYFKKFQPDTDNDLESILKQESRYGQNDLVRYNLADARFILERMKEFPCDGNKSKFLYTLHLYLTLFSHQLMIRDFSVRLMNQNVVPKEEGEKSENLPKELLAFFNGAETPWDILHEKERVDLRFGGFPLKLLWLQRQKSQNSSASDSYRNLIQTATSVNSKAFRKAEITGEFLLFDPLNFSSLFETNNLDNPIKIYEKDEFYNYDLYISFLLISINWDVQKKILEHLEEEQSKTKILGFDQLKHESSGVQFRLPLEQQQKFYKIVAETLGGFVRSDQLRPSCFQYFQQEAFWQDFYGSDVAFLEEFILKYASNLLFALKELEPEQNKSFLDGLKDGILSEFQIYNQEMLEEFSREISDELCKLYKQTLEIHDISTYLGREYVNYLENPETSDQFDVKIYDICDCMDKLEENLDAYVSRKTDATKERSDDNAKK